MEKVQDQDREVRLAFRIGYLGEGFFGSQYQPDHRTVEGEITSACLRAGLFSDSRHARLTISGRTDRGVHARYQIAAFTTSLPERAVRALPGQLPPDIWVTDYAVVDASFSPRYDIISRTYRYLYGSLPHDCTAMERTASLFIGKHDFSCFARIEPGKNPVRTVNAVSVHHDSDLCWIEVTAQSFLWHMVRCIASALFLVSEGKISHDTVSQMISGRCTNKVKPAPPEGLILWEITDTLDWKPIPPQKKTIRLHKEALSHHIVMAEIHRLLKP